MKMIGFGFICAFHSEGHTEETQLCRFPEARGKLCHQCGGEIPDRELPIGLENSVGYCSNKCDDAWNAEHPGFWIPISETLPGGRYDGVWENSGLAIPFDGKMGPRDA